MKRPAIILTAICVIALITLAALGAALASARKSASNLEAAARDLAGYAARCRTLNDAVMSLSARGRNQAATSAADAIDRTLAPLGLKDRIKSVKALPSTPKEELAELSMTGLTPNELANALYSFETAPMLLVIRKADMRSSFERAGTLNVTLTLALVKP